MGEQKFLWAQKVALHMDVANNQSPSFNYLGDKHIGGWWTGAAGSDGIQLDSIATPDSSTLIVAPKGLATQWVDHRLE